MSQKVKQYELTILNSLYTHEDNIKDVVKKITELGSKNELFKIISVNEIGRYETNKDHEKMNMTCIKFESHAEAIKDIVAFVSKVEFIAKYMLIKSKNKIKEKFLDYKQPIEMKKYMFESGRIMPLELTQFSKKTQKVLAKNMKRARLLGLIGKSKK